MKSLTIAIIGHRKVSDARRLKLKLMRVLSTLIEEENAETFLFGSNSDFDTLCLETVTHLKERFFPLIKRIHVRAMYEKLNEQYKQYIFTFYDETYFPYGVKNAGYYSYVKRNYAMIDRCDILLTYYNTEYQLPNGKTSGTRIAYEYALKKHKRIINIFEEEQ